MVTYLDEILKADVDILVRYVSDDEVNGLATILRLLEDIGRIGGDIFSRR